MSFQTFTIYFILQAGHIKANDFQRLRFRVIKTDGAMMPVQILFHLENDFLGDLFRLEDLTKLQTAVVDQLQFSQSLADDCFRLYGLCNVMNNGADAESAFRFDRESSLHEKFLFCGG